MKTAQRGGETGRNGEFYKGGQFLPNTTEGKRHWNRKRATGKQEIEPGVWADPPSDGARSIYRRLSGVAWFDGLRCAAHEGYLSSLSPEAAAAHLATIDAFNAGRRWS